MAMSKTKSEIGNACSHPRRNAGSISGLASSLAQEAGFGHRGKLRTPYAKTKTRVKIKPKLRVSIWNVQTYQPRIKEVFETL